MKSILASVCLILAGCYNSGYDPDTWIGLEKSKWLCTEYKNESHTILIPAAKGQNNLSSVTLQECHQWSKVQ